MEIACHWPTKTFDVDEDSSSDQLYDSIQDFDVSCISYTKVGQSLKRWSGYRWQELMFFTPGIERSSVMFVAPRIENQRNGNDDGVLEIFSDRSQIVRLTAWHL